MNGRCMISTFLVIYLATSQISLRSWKSSCPSDNVSKLSFSVSKKELQSQVSGKSFSERHIIDEQFRCQVPHMEFTKEYGTYSQETYLYSCKGEFFFSYLQGFSQLELLLSIKMRMRTGLLDISCILKTLIFLIFEELNVSTGENKQFFAAHVIHLFPYQI